MTIFTSMNYLPRILMDFDPNLLSRPMPNFSDDSKTLFEIMQFLEKKIYSNKYKKFPRTIEKFIIKHKHFLELYERAKAKEEQNQKEKGLKTWQLFYRIRMPNQDDRTISKRLMQKRTAGKSSYRKNNALSKI